MRTTEALGVALGWLIFLAALAPIARAATPDGTEAAVLDSVEEPDDICIIAP